MTYELKPLTCELTGIYLKQFLMMDLIDGGEAWESRHFLSDVPGKWECSWVALDGDQPIGFVIASIKPGGLHVHRIAVHASYQRRGLGTALLQHAAQRAVDRGLPLLTLRVPKQNHGAIAFYHRLGFHSQEIHPGHFDLSLQPERLLISRG